MKRLKQGIIAVHRNSAIFLLNGLLVFIVIELIATVFITLAKTSVMKTVLARTTGMPNDLIKYYASLPYYAQHQWAAQYWEEHKSALKKKYHPYVIWRSPPFEGEQLKIDQNGIRYTPAAKCFPKAKKVFLFGGSAMWGWGSPDWGTIPAYLQKHLQSMSDEPVCIVNFAENAYISTQNLIKLILLLEAGNIPDVVVFYDGVNEVLAIRQTDASSKLQRYIRPLSRHSSPVIKMGPGIGLNQTGANFHLSPFYSCSI